VRAQLLSTSKVMTLQDLNASLSQWLEADYHERMHSSTRQTPMARYLKHAHLVRVAPKDLDDYFRVRVQRKVDKDRTVSLNGRLYEAPVDLIGRMVTLLFHEADPARVEVFSDGSSQGMLVPLDLNVNCRVRRSHYKVELVPTAGSDAAPETEKRYEGGKLFGKEDGDGVQ
jgi:putative transposase